MRRVWALAGAIFAAYLLILPLAGFVGPTGQLYAGLCVGSGVAAAYVAGSGYLARGLYLFGGVLIGAVGFILASSTFPDTKIGLFLGAAVPLLFCVLVAFPSRKQANLIAALIGAGTLSGLYATTFDLDPQGLNTSLPIAVGQVMVPLAFGFVVGVLIREFVPDDGQAAAAEPPAQPPPVESEPAEPEAAEEVAS